MKASKSSLRHALESDLDAKTAPKKLKLSKSHAFNSSNSFSSSSSDGDDDNDYENSSSNGNEKGNVSDIENDLELAKTSSQKRDLKNMGIKSVLGSEPEFEADCKPKLEREPNRRSRRVATHRKDYRESSSEDLSVSCSEDSEMDDEAKVTNSKKKDRESFKFFSLEDMPAWDDKYTDLDHYKKDMDDDLINAVQINPDSLKKDFVKLNTYDDKMMLLNKKLEVRIKYKTKYPKLPVPPYFLELKEQIEPYLKEVPDLLKARTSTFYYATAKEMHANSSRPTVTDGDIKAKLMSEPEKLTAGAYGLKRQFQVGEWIIDRYQKEIMGRYGNPVIKWWGYEDFARYILSCDVLTRLLKDQMRLRSLKKAFEVMKDTVDYGNFVSDDDPFHPWELDIELEKIKDSNLDEKYQSTFYRK
ncbi:hypothetical protein ACO0QE_002204 [Hanseniaspora vineae]